MTPLLTMLSPLLGSLLDRVIPDPKQAAEARLKALEMASQGELRELEAMMEIAKAQAEINKEDAKGNWYQSGWRPTVGYCCVLGLIYQFFLQPVLPWVVKVAGVEVPPLPEISTEDLMILLSGLLGLGAFRTYEKTR